MFGKEIIFAAGGFEPPAIPNRKMSIQRIKHVLSSAYGEGQG